MQVVEGVGMRGGPLAYGWRRVYSLPPSLSHHSGMSSLAELADWRHNSCRRRQLEATEVSAAKAVQPEPTVGSGLDEKVEAVGAEDVEEEHLPPVLHKAWEASRLRALNEVLGVELQPEELLLGAVEAPWGEESGEVSSGEEAKVRSPLQPGGLAPKRMRDGSSGQDGRGKQQQKRRKGRQSLKRSWREEARQWQVEHARVQCTCRPWQCRDGGW